MQNELKSFKIVQNHVKSLKQNHVRSLRNCAKSTPKSTAHDFQNDFRPNPGRLMAVSNDVKVARPTTCFFLVKMMELTIKNDRFTWFYMVLLASTGVLDGI